jgi:hypothetical protein
MIIKYKSRRHNAKWNPYHHKLNKTKKHIHSREKSHMVLNLHHDEEDDNREKSTFNKKYQHFDKVNLILSNLENKRHAGKSRNGRTRINYRNYRQGFN